MAAASLQPLHFASEASRRDPQDSLHWAIIEEILSYDDKNFQVMVAPHSPMLVIRSAQRQCEFSVGIWILKLHNM